MAAEALSLVQKGTDFGLCRFVHAPAQEQVNAPDTSGTEPPASQAVVEIRDHLFRQVSQFNASDAGEDVAVNQRLSFS